MDIDHDHADNANRAVSRTPSAPLRAAAGHGAQHDQHDRHRAVHHHPAADDRARRPAGHAGLGDRAGDRHLRRHDLERARRGDAALRRFVRLSARSLRPRAARPADGVPVRLAVHPQRPARDRVRLHRLLPVPRLHLAVGVAAPAARRGGGRRAGEHRAPLPADHVDREDHRQPLDRDPADDGRGDRSPGHCTSTRRWHSTSRPARSRSRSGS